MRVARARPARLGICAIASECLGRRRLGSAACAWYMDVLFSGLPALVESHKKALYPSPHGMLDPWALRNSRWKKRAALWVYEKRNLQRATCLHALCKAEAQRSENWACAIRSASFPMASISRIQLSVASPYGAMRLPRSAKICSILGGCTRRKV